MMQIERIILSSLSLSLSFSFPRLSREPLLGRSTEDSLFPPTIMSSSSNPGGGAGLGKETIEIPITNTMLGCLNLKFMNKRRKEKKK